LRLAFRRAEEEGNEGLKKSNGNPHRMTRIERMRGQRQKQFVVGVAGDTLRRDGNNAVAVDVTVFGYDGVRAYR
jgi:hypothetical protein